MQVRASPPPRRWPRSTSPCQMASRPAPQSGSKRSCGSLSLPGCKRRLEPAAALAPVAARQPEIPDRAADPQCDLGASLLERVTEDGTDVVVLCFDPVEPDRRAPGQQLGPRQLRKLEEVGAVPIAGRRRRRSPRVARARTRGSSRASRSAPPCGGRGSCRRATAACRARRRRRSRPLPGCSRRRTPRAWRTGPSRQPRAGRSSIRSSPAASAGAPRHRVRPSRDRGAARAAPGSGPGVRTLVRAAASSTASGRLSSRRQSSAMSSLGLSRERAQKSSTASGCASGGTGYSTSPRTRNSSRLVTKRRRFGQDSSSEASSGAASTTCSKLSSSKSSSRSPMCSARPSLAPNVCATVSATRAGIAKGGEPDPEDAVPELRHQLGRRLDRQPRLPRTTRAGQRHQPRAVLQQLRRRPTPPAPGRRTTTPAAADSCSRSSSAAESAPRPAGRSTPAAEKSFTLCSPRSASSPLDKRARRLRNQNLPTVAGSDDPRRPVHIQSPT